MTDSLIPVAPQSTPSPAELVALVEDRCRELQNELDAGQGYVESPTEFAIRTARLLSQRAIAGDHLAQARELLAASATP